MLLQAFAFGNIRAISKHRREKKKSLACVILAFMPLRVAEEFPSRSPGGVEMCDFPQCSHGIQWFIF